MSNNMFKSAKYQAVVSIFNSEKKEGVTSHRQRCLKRIMAETGMGLPGASTYYANVKSYFEDGGVTEKVLSVSKVVEKVKEELWSAVKLDEDELAYEVMTFHNVEDALKYSQENVTYLMRGTQRYGAELGVEAKFNEDGDEIDDEGQVIAWWVVAKDGHFFCCLIIP